MDRQAALAMLHQLRPRGPAAGIRTQGMRKIEGEAVDPRPTFGLGLTRGGMQGDYRIAVRVQDERLLKSTRLDAIVEATRGEVDVAYVGIPEAWSGTSNPTDRVRPIEPGCSISTTASVSAGTLGCFVEDDRGTYLLSNSHVVADFAAAADGEHIVQPGRLDGGDPARDQVAKLDRAVPVDPTAQNVADAAIAWVGDGQIEPSIPGVGRPLTAPSMPDIGDRVMKRGRTTAVTQGIVISTNVNLKIAWPVDPVEFIDLIEIEGPDPASPFAQPGDSGSLIVRGDGPVPLALLFAGGPVGGLTRVYAMPIATVLRELSVRMH